MNEHILRAVIEEKSRELAIQLNTIIPRSFDFKKHFGHPEISIIKGVRRCGKSVLLKQLYQESLAKGSALFVDFEDARLDAFKSEDFEIVYKILLEKDPKRERQGYVFFDEIQNVAGWERWMNFFTYQKKIKVFVTGSNTSMISSELGTHLTGRHIDTELFPLSFSEVIKYQDKDLFNAIRKKEYSLTIEERVAIENIFKEYFQYGGFPRIWLGRERTLLNEYFQDILYRDIIKRYKVRESKALRQLGLFLMTDMSRLINKSKLARDLELKEQRTVAKYLGYYVDSYLGYEIRKFSASLRKQARNLTKYYAIDHVLARQLSTQIQSKDSAYLENLVLLELKRRGNEVNYWNSDNNKKEVDFVMTKGGNPIDAVQVSWSLQNKDTRERELSALYELLNKHRSIESAIIVTAYEEDNLSINSKKVSVIPFYCWAVR